MSRLRKWLLKILPRKEVPDMAVVYATLIVKGKKTIEQVPALILNSLLTSEPPWAGHQQAVFFCLEFMRDQGATLYHVNLDIKVQKLQNKRGKSRKP